MRAAGLSAPDRLQQAYRSHGGGGTAVAELTAERSFVASYSTVASAVNGQRATTCRPRVRASSRAAWVTWAA